jgi:cytochrome bd-type quinol oxidase subunit 2
MITNTLIFKSRVTAILLIAAGYGWAGGHFIPADSAALVYLFQFVILLILLILSLGFFSGKKAAEHWQPHARWAVIGLNIFTTLTLIINIANIVRGATGAAANSFGSHNTLADLIPIGMIMAGDLLWLLCLISDKKIPEIAD